MVIGMQIFDLTGMIDVGIWDYGEPYVPFLKDNLACLEKNGYIANRYQITGHLGTHVECMAHWKNNIPGIESEGLTSFYGLARVLKMENLGHKEITIDDLKEAGAEQLEKDEICILATGWDCHWSQDDYVLESPYLSSEGAKYLAEKHIKLIAMDTPMIGSPADGIDKIVEGAYPSDFYFLNNGINILLGLVKCTELPSKVILSALPLKIKGAEGSPVRAVAIAI